MKIHEVETNNRMVSHSNCLGVLKSSRKGDLIQNWQKHMNTDSKYLLMHTRQSRSFWLPIAHTLSLSLFPPWGVVTAANLLRHGMIWKNRSTSFSSSSRTYTSEKTCWRRCYVILMCVVCWAASGLVGNDMMLRASFLPGWAPLHVRGKVSAVDADHKQANLRSLARF